MIKRLVHILFWLPVINTNNINNIIKFLLQVNIGIINLDEYKEINIYVFI